MILSTPVFTGRSRCHYTIALVRRRTLDYHLLSSDNCYSCKRLLVARYQHRYIAHHPIATSGQIGLSVKTMLSSSTSDEQLSRPRSRTCLMRVERPCLIHGLITQSMTRHTRSQFAFVCPDKKSSQGAPTRRSIQVGWWGHGGSHAMASMAKGVRRSGSALNTT